MAVGDPEDIARSVRRYLGLMLTQPWDLRLQREEVRDDRRPAGFVEMGREAERWAREGAIPQGDRIMFAPVTISLFPALAEPRAAGRDARQLAGLVRDLMQAGGDGILFASGRPACGPKRIPLWDYSEAGPGQAGPQFPVDVLRVENLSVDPVQDTMDARRWAVIAELRLSYELGGRVSQPAPVVERIISQMPEDALERDAGGWVVSRAAAG